MKTLVHPAAKPVLFAAALLPVAHLLSGAIAGNLGANPAEALIRGTGDWTLVGCTVSPGFRFEGFELAPPGFAIP